MSLSYSSGDQEVRRRVTADVTQPLVEMGPVVHAGKGRDAGTRATGHRSAGRCRNAPTSSALAATHANRATQLNP